MNAMEFYSGTRQKKILPFATIQMDHIEDSVLSEMSYTETDKYCMVSLVCRFFYMASLTCGTTIMWGHLYHIHVISSMWVHL